MDDEDDSILNQPYDIQMDEQFKDRYQKRLASGSDNVKRKTRKVIERPTSGSYGGENQLKKIWTTHAGEFVLGWDITIEDDSGTDPPKAEKDDIKLVYLWFILHHDTYTNQSSVPAKNSTDVLVEFEVRIYYPAYSGPEEPAENPHSVKSKLFNIYNELESVENVTQVWEHDDVDDCLLLKGTTIQPDIEKVESVTMTQAHLTFENGSVIE